MKEKMKYEEPCMVIKMQAKENVITTSQLIDGGSGTGGEFPWEDFQ